MLISAGTPLGDVAADLGNTVDDDRQTHLHPTETDLSAEVDRVFGAIRKPGRQVGKEWEGTSDRQGKSP
jgi:hypothetical protein